MANIIRLEKREEVAAGTTAFYFSRPEGFDFKPGQSIDITLIDPPETDAEGNTRSFSIITAPHEPYLGIATRMRDTAFKRVLKNLPAGAEISMEGPFGSMTLHNDASKPAIFLAGGIGITPFYSMVKFAAHTRTPHKIYLFYSNRRPEDAAFLQELQELQRQNPSYRLVATMTQIDKSTKSWEGETSYISKDLLLKYAGDISNSIAYIAGPPAMGAAMRKILNEAGLNDDYIRMEEFTGY